MKIHYRSLGTLKVTVPNGIEVDATTGNQTPCKEVYTGIVSIDTYSDGGCKYVRLWTFDNNCHMLIDNDIEFYIEEA